MSPPGKSTNKADSTDKTQEEQTADAAGQNRFFHLLSDDKLRLDLLHQLLGGKAVEVFYQGDSKEFGECLLRSVNE